MKKFIVYTLLTVCIGCAETDQRPLRDRISLNISECRNDCSRDSLGLRENRVIDGNLRLRFGYMVNCIWSAGYIDEVLERNDSLIIRMDRPHSLDTISMNDNKLVTELIYPLADCDCFYFFSYQIENYTNPPSTVHIVDLSASMDWDQLPYRKFVDIEEIPPATK